MRIIDEKGRLFEKINVIDFAVIVFLLSLTPMFYFGYKILNYRSSVGTDQKHQENIREDFVEIKISARFVKLSPDILERISAGDKEKDKDGNVIGEIVSIGWFSPYEREIELGEDKKLINKDASLKQADVVLRVNAQLRDKNIYYKDRQIVENGMLEFSTEKYSVGIEGVTILKDDYNVVAVKRVTMDKNLEDIRQELGIFRKRADDSLLEVNKRLNVLESIITAEIKNKKK